HEAIDRRPDRRPRDQSLMDHHLAGPTGKLDAHARELHAAAGPVGRAGSDAVERRLAADRELPYVHEAVLLCPVRRRRGQGGPHLSAGHARIGGAEAEQRTGIGRLQIHDLPFARAPAQLTVQDTLTRKPRRRREIADRAAAPRQAQVEIAQHFALEARDRPDLGVDINIDGPALLYLRRARHRRLDEVAAVEGVAAHRDPVEIVGGAFELEARLVAVGQSEHRKRAGYELAVLIEFHAAPD